ncbi:MAG TPA: TonB-dependent receptor [Pyrinomonadaceae bacterium]|jgi:iron complex outermembrane receptor protein
MKHSKYLFTVTALLFVFSIAAYAQNGKVSGKVTYGDGTPMHDAAVQITQLNRTVSTDADGRYVFESVAPGRYTLLVHIEGFADATRIVEVAAGSAHTADFQMQVTGLKEQVTITASGTEQSVFDSFQSVNAIGSSVVTQRSAVSLGEVLEGETGVAKRSFGAGSSRPVIRGFDGDRVLVLENGVRSGTVGSQSGDHGETVDTLSAERIEVVKGPGTLLYGSNALGGVVNVVDNDENESHNGFRGFLTTTGGTANREAALAAGGEYGIRNWLFRGNFTAQRAGDYQTPLGRVPNSASRANSESFGVGYYGKKAYLSGNFTTDVRRYGIPFAAIFEGGGEPSEFLGGGLPAVDEDVDIRQRDYGFRLAGGFRDLNNPFLSGIQYNFGYSDYRHKEIEVADGAEEIGTIFDNKTFTYRSMFEQTKYKKLTGRFGFDGFSRDYLVNGAEQLVNGQIKQNAFSVFGLEELSFERVKLQFGARVENNRYGAENPAYLDRSFTGFSGAAGVNFGLWKGGALVVNYSNSYRAPALEELYNNGPHIGNVTYEIGNQNLVAERSNGVDVSLRHQSEKFRVTGDVYYYDIDNFVHLAYQDEDGDGLIDIEDGLPVARYEQGRAKYLGAEISADATFNKYLGGFLSADVVRARLVDADENLPRIPPARLRAGFDVRYRNLNVRPEAIFAARQNKTAPLETPTAGYGIVNVAGTYTIGRPHFAHVFTFNAYNLTNKLYRNHLSFIKGFAPEIGRGIRFGYTIRFF